MAVSFFGFKVSRVTELQEYLYAIGHECQQHWPTPRSYYVTRRVSVNIDHQFFVTLAGAACSIEWPGEIEFTGCLAVIPQRWLLDKSKSPRLRASSTPSLSLSLSFTSLPLSHPPQPLAISAVHTIPRWVMPRNYTNAFPSDPGSGANEELEKRKAARRRNDRAKTHKHRSGSVKHERGSMKFWLF